MPTVLMIGNFDGVHLGHAALVRRARDLATPDGRVIALAFFPHPRFVLRPDDDAAPLTTFEERAARLRDAGVDDVVPLEPTTDILSRTPEQFVQMITDRFRPDAIVEGDDFRFGRARSGDVHTLARLGRTHGFDVHVVDAVEVALTDQTVIRASTTITRWLIERGRVLDAARVLGRPHILTGTVVRGEQRGRQIGFPTANLDAPVALPADGVYAGIADLPDGQARPAAVHIGPRAVFGDRRRTVEGFILDWHGPAPGASRAAPSYDYGWPLGLRLIAWLRDQAGFGTVEELVDQIRRDVERTRTLTADVLDGQVAAS